MQWTLWCVVRLLSEAEWPTLVDDHGHGKSRGGMPERFSHPDLVDLASLVLLLWPAYWAKRGMAQAVVPVFAAVCDVVVEVVCLVVRWVVVVVGTD